MPQTPTTSAGNTQENRHEVDEATSKFRWYEQNTHCWMTGPLPISSSPKTVHFGPTSEIESTATDNKEDSEVAKDKGLRGSIVLLDTRTPLPMQAFEISDEFRISQKRQTTPYSFTSSNRRSIMLSLGLDALDPDEVDESLISRVVSSTSDDCIAAQSMDPYTKVADDVCTKNYMAIVIGFGAWCLPSAMKDTGLIPGLICIALMGALNLFWAHRLIELPRLLRTNLELYGDIVNAICPYRILQLAAQATILGTWYSGMVLYYHNLSPYTNLERSPNGIPSTATKLLCLSVEVCLCAVLIGSSFHTKARDLQKNATWSLRAMIVILVLIMLLGSYRVMVPTERPLSTGRYSTIFWPDARHSNPAQGIRTICISYCGLGMTPYVISDMLHPENARTMMNKAITKITFYFLLAALFGYIGWGDEAKSGVKKLLESDKTMLAHAVSILTNICFLGNCLCCYVLLFSPFIREVEALLALEDSLQVRMGLPWAIRRQQHIKECVRSLIVVSSMLFCWAYPDYKCVEQVSSTLFLASNLVMPVMFSLLATLMHRRPRNDSLEPPIFGSQLWQAITTVLLAVASVTIGLAYYIVMRT